jgi:flavin reductase (DIM6/NTAB) family NADH-FMN oxidoreductase RutF
VLDPAAFRSVLGRFATGVTVVTLRAPDGRDRGLTVSAFCSLSLDPPLVLVCVDRQASLHEDFLATAHFGVNILGADQEDVSRRFAEPEADRFEGLAYQWGETGVALLGGAVAQLECRVYTTYDGGDHTIFVGEVIGGRTSTAERPLLYYRGGYAQLER